MGVFDSMEVAESVPTEGGIRGLTGEIVEVANAAIADGKPRSMPLTEATDKVVGIIKRYLSQEGWGCKVRKVNNKIFWEVTEKKEITPEHKAKMLAALEVARQKKAAAAAAAPAPEGSPAESPAATAAETPTPANGASKATAPKASASK